MRARGGEAAQVEGLPESALALASQTARAKGDEASTTEGGPWVITLDAPAYMPVMQYAKDRSLREKIYRFTSASRARANLLRAYLCRSIGANWHSRSKSPSTPRSHRQSGPTHATLAHAHARAQSL